MIQKSRKKCNQFIRHLGQKYGSTEKIHSPPRALFVGDVQFRVEFRTGKVVAEQRRVAQRLQGGRHVAGVA